MRSAARLLVGAVVPAACSGRAILGIDLGSLYMKVALVQRNSPLEIVTNLHSKRKTEQMVLFDAGSRFYGADASSLIARKPHSTPTGMSVLLGRGDDHPVVQTMVERHYPLAPIYNSTRSGICLTVDSQSFTPEELVSMVLSHAKDITAAYSSGISTIKDCVLTVPSFYTQHERRALLDAASLANLNVLALIDENTAAALHFGIDRVDDTAQNILFYNMGASALQVSIVQFHSYERKEAKYGKPKRVGAFEVKGKGWDATLGGESFDARLVNYMVDDFNAIWNKKHGGNKDVRNYPRAMAKLRIQANKVKHVLSANNDVPVFIDALQDDVNYQTHINRATFEEICHDLLLKSTNPIFSALKAANMTLEDIHSVELIGGGMRVPRVQDEIKRMLGEKLDLGMHINSDESMALGAAFHGANISTAFRVRHVGMTDLNPFPIAVRLDDLPIEEKRGLFGFGRKKEDSEDGGEEGPWSKQATVFKSNGKIGVKKTIAFTHDKDVACAIDYEESEILPAGTELAIERYNITGIADFAKEIAAKGLGKPKVSLQFDLSTSGLTQLVKAEAVVEETVIVKEEVEINDDDKEEPEANQKEEGKPIVVANETEKKEDGPSEENSANKSENATENQTDAEPKKKKKRTKTIEVEKKKVHKKSLDVKTYHIGRVRPYSYEIRAESTRKLELLAQKDKERMMLEAARNKVEGYIYYIKNKLMDDEEDIAAVSTEEQRRALLQLAQDGEEWMYEDGYDADLASFEAKFDELAGPAEKLFFRLAEAKTRPEAVKALLDKLGKVEDLMQKWETTMPQVTEEERIDVLVKVEEARKWIGEKVAQQADADPASDPVFKSDEVPLQTKGIESAVSKLSRKPKPKVAKNETTTDSTKGTATSNKTQTNETQNEERKEEKSEAPFAAEDVDDEL